MKNVFKKTAIAVSVSLVLGSSMAWAADAPVAGTLTANNLTDVSVVKTVNDTSNVAVDGTVQVKGVIGVDSSSVSLVDNKQLNHDNSVKSAEGSLDPQFTSTTGAITGNTGNLGVNATSGVNNQQDNAAAISASSSPAGDYAFVLGATQADTVTRQDVHQNDVNLTGAQLVASTGAITGNAGNVGVNVSAGVSNLQKNNLAISSGDSGLAEASSATLQETSSITTTIADNTGNVLGIGAKATTYTSTLGEISGNAGNIGVNLATGSNNLQANSLAIASVTK